MDISPLSKPEDFVTLRNLFKKEEYRSLDHSKTFQRAENELDNIANSGLSPTNIELATDIFRMLRNACVNCHGNQEIIMSLKVPDVAIKIISSPARVDDKTNVLRLCGLQFLGNFVANNRATRDYLWKIAFPERIESFFELKSEEKHFNVLIMILYNCLMSSNALNELMTSESGRNIVQIVCGRLSTLKNQEWSLLCITEQFINHENFLPFIFTDCSVDVRCDVLTVICDAVKQGEQGKQELKWMPLAVKAISKHLVNQIQKLSGEFMTDKESECFSLLLQSICSMTAIPGSWIENLQEEDDDLVAHIIILLREICKTSQIKNEMKASSETASNTTGSPGGSAQEIQQTNGHHQLASHHLRRDLIRLTGNLCFKNRSIQDKVRILEGIPLIMESCNIDDANPFMQQWALFTIRNLCDGNLKNQKEIAKLEKLGVADSPVLRSMGLSAVEDDQGKIRLIQDREQ